MISSTDLRRPSTPLLQVFYDEAAIRAQLEIKASASRGRDTRSILRRVHDSRAPKESPINVQVRAFHSPLPTARSPQLSPSLPRVHVSTALPDRSARGHRRDARPRRSLCRCDGAARDCDGAALHGA